MYHQHVKDQQPVLNTTPPASDTSDTSSKSKRIFAYHKPEGMTIKMNTKNDLSESSSEEEAKPKETHKKPHISYMHNKKF